MTRSVDFYYPRHGTEELRRVIGVIVNRGKGWVRVKETNGQYRTFHLRKIAGNRS